MPADKKAPETAHSAKAVEPPSIVDQIVAKAESSRSEGQRADVKRALTLLLQRAPEVRESVFDARVEELISRRIRALDDAVSTHLDRVMHHPKFQALEASWRSLNRLAVGTRLAKDLKVKVIDVTRSELERDLGVGRAGQRSYQDSVLFRKIHEEEYGTPGGAPYGALVGDFEFSNDERDIGLLSQIAKVAAVSHAPFIAAAKPEMFGWSDFKETQGGNALFKLLEGDEYAHWNRFRSNPDSRYVGLVLPRYLVRAPHRRNEQSPEFTYQENLGEKSRPQYLYGNAALVYGQILTRAFAEHGWCTAIRGEENGGSVHLPFFALGKQGVSVGPTEVAVTHSREKEFSEQGFLSLCQIKGQTQAVFYGGQSCQAPTAYYENEAQDSATLSARLPYIFAVSRFAHHLKKMLYRKIGSPIERRELEDFLNRWINKFVLDKANATGDEKARFPLAEAKITVESLPGRPGEYDAVARLRPHIQLEQVNVSLRLVSKVPDQVVR